MSGKRDRFILPRSETKERADADATKARAVAAFRTIETPVEIAFWSRCMHFGIDLPVVCFLINNEAFRAGRHDSLVFVSLHWADFDCDRCEIRREPADAIGEITAADEFRMFAGDDKDVAKTFRGEMTRLGQNLIKFERDAKDWIVARKS